MHADNLGKRTKVNISYAKRQLFIIKQDASL